MSKKHVDRYYQEVCQQYIDMNEAIKELEDACNTGLISPDKLDEMKAAIEPLKNNYMTLSYIMFLLNKPNRKKKQKTYVRQNKKLLDKIPHENTDDGIKEQNSGVIEHIKNLS